MLGNPDGEDTVEGLVGGVADKSRDSIADLPVEVLLDIMASLRFGET